MGATVRRRVFLSGRVQGVFFRDSCRRRALAAQLAGTVRNLPDGRVEAIFEGPADAVDGLIAWCRRGPRLAEVSAVEILEEAPEGLTGFGLR
jgi:acylphosphatase